MIYVIISPRILRQLRKSRWKQDTFFQKSAKLSMEISIQNHQNSPKVTKFVGLYRSHLLTYRNSFNNLWSAWSLDDLYRIWSQLGKIPRTSSFKCEVSKSPNIKNSHQNGGLPVGRGPGLQETFLWVWGRWTCPPNFMSLGKNFPMDEATKTKLRMAPLSHFGLRAHKTTKISNFAANFRGDTIFGVFSNMFSIF